MLFDFSLVLSSSAEILSGLTLQIHLTIFATFLSSLITSSFLTGQFSLSCSITLRTHTEYNRPFVPKGIQSLNLDHPFLILVITMSNKPVMKLCYYGSYLFSNTFEIVTQANIFHRFVESGDNDDEVMTDG